MVLSIKALACIWYNCCRTLGLAGKCHSAFTTRSFLNLTSSTYDVIKDVSHEGYRTIQFKVQQVLVFAKRLNLMYTYDFLVMIRAATADYLIC